MTITRSSGGPVPGSLATSSQSVSIAVTQGSSPSAARLTVSNDGGGLIGFTATFSTASGGEWLQVTPTSGSLSAGSPVTLAVTADPGRLGVGTFSSAILLASGDTGQQRSIPVTLAIGAVAEDPAFADGADVHQSPANAFENHYGVSVIGLRPQERQGGRNQSDEGGSGGSRQVRDHS